MKLSRLWILTLCALLFASGLQAQQPPLSPEEEKAVLKALIDRDAFRELTRELQAMVNDYMAEVELREERLAAERQQRLAEKKIHLAALLALKEYRITRRPLIVKIFTVGIVRDKHDTVLEAQITALQKEISEWH